VKLDARLFSGAALILGGYVVLTEIPFWASRSSLAPALTALGLGVIALAIAHLLHERES